MRVAGAIILVLLVIVATTAPWLAPADPFAMAAPPLLPPSAAYLFGTDDLGRDVFSGVVYGARTSLLVGLAAAGLAAGFGLLVGGTAAVRGGMVDESLMRGSDFVQALPRFLLVVTIVSLFGHRFELIVLIIGITEWPSTARLFRAHAITILKRDFAQAAYAVGATDRVVVMRHVLPLAASVMTAQISYHAGGAILVEAGLSVLGLGDPTVMSWGALLGEANRFVREAWWMSVFPGVAVTLTILGCNLLAEGLVHKGAVREVPESEAR